MTTKKDIIRILEKLRNLIKMTDAFKWLARFYGLVMPETDLSKAYTRIRQTGSLWDSGICVFRDSTKKPNCT